MFYNNKNLKCKLSIMILKSKELRHILVIIYPYNYCKKFGSIYLT